MTNKCDIIVASEERALNGIACRQNIECSMSCSQGQEKYLFIQFCTNIRLFKEVLAKGRLRI